MLEPVQRATMTAAGEPMAREDFDAPPGAGEGKRRLVPVPAG